MIFKKNCFSRAKRVLFLSLLFLTQENFSYTADLVNIQYEKPFYFIHIYYTMPNLQQARKAHIRFNEIEREKILSTYLKLIEGAEFFFNKQKQFVDAMRHYDDLDSSEFFK